MGREIHYSIEQHRPFTTAEKASAKTIIDSFNSFIEWPIDGFNLAFNYAPGVSPHATDQRLEALTKEGVPDDEACAALENEGRWSRFGADGSIDGSSKPGSDEHAFFLLAGLVGLSRTLHDAHIKIQDEGELLRCDVVIEQGCARPDFDAISRWIDARLASLVAQKWKDKLGALQGSPVARCLLPNNYSFDVEASLTEEMESIGEWIPAYEALWKAKHTKPLDAYEARQFFVSPGLFIRSDLLSLPDINEFLSKGGRRKLRQVRADTITKQGVRLDLLISECILAAVHPARPE